MKKKYTKDELYEAGFDSLMDQSKHDIAEMYWDTLTDKEKLEQGRRVLKPKGG